MDERSSKRARQQREVGGAGGGRPPGDDGFGAGGGFAHASLVGCHLRVEAGQKHLFIGMPIDIKVSLLNDEDVLQHVTHKGINVSVTVDGGKVLAAKQNVFELTPQRPAILDGTSTFQLRLWQGCDHFGDPIRVKVEAASGRAGEQVQALSESIMVCRSALSVVKQPLDSWYKDEGGKNNCLLVEVMVREKTAGQPTGQVQAAVPLCAAIVYEGGTQVHSQDILQVQADTQLVTNEHGRATLKFKITEVSQRHQGQRFCIRIGPDTRISPECSDVAPVTTGPIMVLSKRKNRRIKEKNAHMQKGAADAAYASNGAGGSMTMHPSVGLNGLIWASVNGQQPQPSLESGPQHWVPPAVTPMLDRGGRLTSPAPPPPSPSSQHSIPHPLQHHMPQGTPAPNAPADALGAAGGGAPSSAPSSVSVPVEPNPLRVPSAGLSGLSAPMKRVFRWTDTVLQLLQMELQWEHIGYEREPNGSSVSYDRPLFRCPLCRVCKGGALPHQKHAADCRLRGLLDEFEGRTASDFEEVIREQRQLREVQQQQQQQQRHQQDRGSSPSSTLCPPPQAAAAAAAEGRAGERGGRTSRMDIGLERAPVSAIMGLKSASDGASGEERRADESNVAVRGGAGAGVGVPCPTGAAPSGNPFFSGMPSHEFLARGGSGGLGRGLSIGFPMFENNGIGPAGNGGDDSLPRSGSVAPFVPQRSSLTPAEGKAHFIMLPTTAADGNGDGDGTGGGSSSSSSSSKQLTVFSKQRTLLGFYEEKYDIGQQTLLPFLGADGNFTPGEKCVLEAKLQAALDAESSSGGGGGSNGAVAAVDAMDTDNGGGGWSNKRSGPGRPTRSSSAAAAAASSSATAATATDVEREKAAEEKSKEAAGHRKVKVYKLTDFKGFQEMKEQVFYDYLCNVQTLNNVF